MDQLETLLDQNDKLIDSIKNKLKNEFFNLVQKYK